MTNPDLSDFASIDEGPEILPRMKSKDQWMVWRYQHSPGGIRKRPTRIFKEGEMYDEFAAKFTDPKNWSSYSVADSIAKSTPAIDGKGFVLTDRDPFLVIDLDYCVAESGSLNKFAQSIVTEANSYAEISPSGNGVHIYLQGEIPRQGWRPPEKNNSLEIYDRYFVTVTENWIDGTPIRAKENPEYVNTLFNRFDIRWRKGMFGSLWRGGQKW